ncbi:hypothetical protein CEUSTIGMA_g13860.t1 [Chlamydomonas eustigma]|uniref:Reverse transcriptase domain-containing protein n=1 Tax=Chlamydomonas eustigma TaxID=1157962 RepID=A0A250XUG9_9CHLO|nr:hypothetical protein CEUSTIGMA_g13860.t1 [Chlamydomonas eustigma]|eukprot:GAX86450.1 hypothetical protein CEUSTIGMA_g13860.t1 [Chlamydomonas eustigma]
MACSCMNGINKLPAKQVHPHVWQLFFAQLNKLQASGTLSTFTLPNGEKAHPSLGYADDDIYILMGELLELALRIKRLFEEGKKTGLRHLGVPHFGLHEENCKHAFSKVPGTMHLEGLAWNCAQPNKLGRTHISVLNLASKAIYQAAFHKPPANLVAAMQQQVNRFVAKPSCPTEESPIPTQLYPSANICFLPKKAGGLSLPDLNSHFTAMRAKPCWKMFVRSVHPWQQLFRHEVTKAGPAEVFGADWVGKQVLLKGPQTEDRCWEALPTGAMILSYRGECGLPKCLVSYGFFLELPYSKSRLCDGVTNALESAEERQQVRVVRGADQRNTDCVDINLVDMAVREARSKALTHQAIRRRSHSAHNKLPGLTNLGALWPALWFVNPLQHTPPPTTSESQLRMYGLEELEERWRQPLGDDHFIPEELDDQLPAWMRPSASSTRRISPC